MSIQNEQDRLKQVAGNWAAAQLRDGMIVGLGSGSTARLAVEAIGQRVREGLRIESVRTGGTERARPPWVVVSSLSCLY